MEAEFWKSIEDLYQAALLQPLEKRAEFVRQASRGQAELRSEVESLLRAAAEESSFLEDSPISAQAQRGAVDRSPRPTMTETQEGAPAMEVSGGSVIGTHRLLHLIGQGGIGEVWLAEQKQPVRRRVAIKLIKAGMDTREVVTRFESERQALALMDHPAIAKVFDAGSTPAGRPYFVMEYVPGMPITDYCDKHKLTVEQRLRLFVQVCEGVRHAHQKAIIHRDLKPSNILVTEVDDKPLPRIIDFGIAKATSQRLTDNTLVTRVGAILGTPEYMSPEQAGSGGEDVDTRTDVYSLGVILYELLAGTVPLTLRKLTLDEMLRKLRTEDAPRPSTKLRTLGDQAKTTAQKRDTEPKHLMRQVRGDLDSIVLKALEKERGRRYGGPAELAADVEHYLRHEPVSARPARSFYRIWKYGRRHRAGVSFAAVLLLLLVAGVIVSSWMALRANRAEEEAKAVTDFLRNDVLVQASVDSQGSAHIKKPDPNMKVRTALDRAAAKIQGRFSKQPLVEAAIRQTIGSTYGDLGLNSEAEHQFRRVLELRGRILGEENRDTLQSKRSLAALFTREGKYVDAERLTRENLAVERRVLGKEDHDTLVSEQDLAALYRYGGKYDDAETLNRELLSIQQRRLGKDNPVTLQIESNLTSIYMLQGKYAQAEPIQKQLVDAMLRVHGEEKRDTLDAMGNLAMLYGFEDKFTESAALFEKVVAGLRRLEGTGDRDTLLMTEGLAWAYDHEGKYAQSDALFSEVLQTYGRLWGKDYPDRLVAMTDLAGSYRRRGMYNQAEALLTTVLDGRKGKLGVTHPDTLATMGDLGWLYVTEGRYEQARPLLEDAEKKFEKGASDDWERYRIRCALGLSFAGEKQYEKAEPLLSDGCQRMLRAIATIPVDGKWELKQARERLVKLYQESGKPEKASEWQQKLQQAALPS